LSPNRAVAKAADRGSCFIIDDRVAGEYRIPSNVVGRTRRPFKELTIEPLKEPRIVPFMPDDLTARLDCEIPSEQNWQSSSEPTEGTSSSESSVGKGLLVGSGGSIP
jgi:hypothetical protein